MYAKKINNGNRLEITEEQAKKRRYKACKFCSGLKGDVRVHKNAIGFWELFYKKGGKRLPVVSSEQV